ncbi:OLC1v1011255C1 [Oldenlandia corymbosa var. corymbosa]|uniref:OLC1v1011255C1 n=1 Tax=Oldenlandia corymbosa var. corymbosa TaxID=529605 RepID=A0AAV1DTA6_OLDCO|nr:OLC1v1011255C1 [Oldenlandia corymbosa var. corymbosa]
MSWEEAKIREELQMEVERELEEEIKEGICHLAFRLQRLYQQQQKERKARGINNTSKILSEVSISIKLEGGTKIEIKEIKKQLPPENRVIRTTPKVDYQMAHVQRIMACRPPPHRKKFDWANSLRSEPSAKKVHSSSMSNGLDAKSKINAWKQNN